MEEEFERVGTFSTERNLKTIEMTTKIQSQSSALPLFSEAVEMTKSGESKMR